MELLSLNEEKLIILLQVMNNSDEINFFKNNYQNKIVMSVKLMARIQELQNEVKCMNDSRDFEDADSVRSGLSPRLPANLRPLPPFRDPGGMLSRSMGMLRPQR